MQEQVLQKVKQYITETEMIKSRCTVIAGVSGGPDSMVMLDILRRLQEDYECSLRVVHVNHGIRGKEALRDQKTVQKICEEWKIPCCVYSYDLPRLAAEWKMGSEEAGRKVRRAAFEEEKKKCTSSDGEIRIALAHNKNDVAETMLHHLARGSGIRGLAALKPVNGEFIRPVLCLERDEIVDYIKEKGIPSVTDSSNLEDDYTRNRIRHHILPLMTEEINAKAVAHMAEASELFRQAEEYFKAKAEEIAAGCAGGDGTYLLDKEFFAKETILQNYVVREILERLSGHRNDLTAGHIRQVQKLYENQSGRKISLPYGVEALRCYEGVKLQKKTEEVSEGFGETMVLSSGAVKGPATLVSREPGELATIYLDQDITVIGKLKTAADAVINVPTVSRIHAKIRRRDGEYYLTDLNSRNGTSVNGQMLKTGEDYFLKDEDEVDFAQARYIFLK